MFTSHSKRAGRDEQIGEDARGNLAGHAHEGQMKALIGTPAGVVQGKGPSGYYQRMRKWSAAMILEVRGTPRRTKTLWRDDDKRP